MLCGSISILLNGLHYNTADHSMTVPTQQNEVAGVKWTEYTCFSLHKGKRVTWQYTLLSAEMESFISWVSYASAHDTNTQQVFFSFCKMCYWAEKPGNINAWGVAQEVLITLQITTYNPIFWDKKKTHTFMNEETASAFMSCWYEQTRCKLHE